MFGQDSVADTLNALRIVRIIVIDDDYDDLTQSDTLDWAAANIDKLNDELKALSARRPSLELLDPSGSPRSSGELRAELRTIWNDLTPDEMQPFQIRAKAEDSPNAPLSLLQTCIPKDVEFVPLSVAKWRSDGHEHVAKPGVTCIFVDKDLTKANLGPSGGEDIVRQLHDKNQPDLYCGLLTQDATNSADEQHLSERLSTLDRTVPVLGKFRLADPTKVAVALATFLLADDLAKIRRHTSRVLTEAAKKAQEAIGSLGYFLMLASSYSANAEGLHESAGILRVAEVAQRRHTLQQLAINAPVDSVRRVRLALGSQPFSQEDTTLAESLDDRFDTADILLKAMAPTDVGDIYELTGDDASTPKSYVLLAQPCDLMVRQGGERANAGSHFVLAQILPRSIPTTPPAAPSSLPGIETAAAPGAANTADQPVAKDKVMSRRVSIGHRPGFMGEWDVSLASLIYLPCELLDACVLSRDGKARLPVEVDSAIIPTPTWATRALLLDKWAAAAVDRATSGVGQLREHQRGLFRPRLLAAELGPEFFTGKIRLTIQGKGFEVGIQRTGRISSPYARDLLVRYSSYQSRPDLPHSLFGDLT